MPAFLIGVDGGGSGTRVRLARADGTLLAGGEAGPSALAQGIEQACRHIGLAVQRAFAAAGLAAAAPGECAIGLGLAGVHVPAHRAALLARLTGYAAIALDTDAYTTLLGAHGGRPGAVVAVGTGSVGEALRPDGSRQGAGGWGFPVGDEGSGAWLGLHAVRRLHHVLDGRGEAGPLSRTLAAALGHTPAALQDWCAAAGQHAYAQLAPHVFDCEAADAFAAALLQRAAEAAGALARALDPAGRLPLALCGSLGRRFEPRLAAPLRERCVAPQGDAAAGALQLAARALREPSA